MPSSNLIHCLEHAQEMNFLDHLQNVAKFLSEEFLAQLFASFKLYVQLRNVPRDVLVKIYGQIRKIP
jgi:hypothetical protein